MPSATPSSLLYLWDRRTLFVGQLSESLELSQAAATLVQMGAEHQECEVSEIIEDEQRKLVTTPAYMLAQSISEAASGINKLVDRVLELAHH